jgi:plasmid stabilization system protein ParE
LILRRQYLIGAKETGRELRRCAFGRYLIFYSVLEDEVEINHVVHSARDYMRVLFSED